MGKKPAKVASEGKKTERKLMPARVLNLSGLRGGCTILYGGQPLTDPICFRNDREAQLACHRKGKGWQ